LKTSEESGMKNGDPNVSRAGSSPVLRPASIRRATRTGVLALALGAMAGCTDLALYDLDILMGRIPFFSYLRTSVAIDPYEMPRLPAEGSVPVINPRGDVPPPFTQAELSSPEVAGLRSPLEETAQVLVRGQQLYAQHCFACHGPQGMGDGPVVGGGRFPFAPRTDAAAVAPLSDGYLYGIVRVGRGLMPAYGDRMTHLDRWALVHYLRHLGADPGATVPRDAPIAPVDPAGPPTPPETDLDPGAS
jgi:mono/diheme cytochrome c family protein